MARKRAAYRLTPRRRAAIKKAQAASARKRRGTKLRNGLRTAGVVAGAVGSTFVAYHANHYIARPDVAVRHAKIAGKAISKSGNLKKRAKVKAYGTHRKTINLKPRASKNKQVQWHKRGYL